ncbi:MAG: hypothetical protein IJL80_10545, partial [Treponema sp.]|nr:hypothetical protein [Treponema sp.]
MALLVFLLIFLASLYFLRPAYREIDGRMRRAEGLFLAELSETTGLGLTYGSLSPSILTGITISDIRVYDSRTDEDILTIKKAVFRYSLWSLLTRDFDHAFSLLSVSEVKGDFSSEKIAGIRKCLAESRERKKKGKELVLGESGGEAPAPEPDAGPEPEPQAGNPAVSLEVDGVDKGEFLSAEQKAFINKILSILPGKIVFKDVAASYSMKGKNLDFKLGKLSFSKKKDKNVRAVADSGSVILRLSGGGSAATRFNLNGNVVPGFSGSSAILTLSPYLAADYTLQKTQFLVRYADNTIVARSTQRALPYSLSAEYDIPRKTGLLDVDLNGISILSLVKLPLKSPRVKALADSPLTIKAEARLSLADKSFSWAGEGSFDLPPDLLKAEEKLAFKASGNEKLLTVDSLTVTGKALRASLSGKLDLVTKVPDCSLRVDSFLLPNGNRLAFSASVRADGRTVHAQIPRLDLGNVSFSSVSAVVRVEDGFAPFSLSLSSAASSVTGKGFFYWSGGRKLSASVSLDSLRAATVAEAACFFPDSKKAGTLGRYTDRLSPVVADGEMSFSTAFH